MNFNKALHTFVVACTCTALAIPQIAIADQSSGTTLGVPVSKTIQDVALKADGSLQGAIVDGNGRPIHNAPVVIGINGKAIAQIRTDQEGRFAATGLKQGTYQVISHGGAHNYRVWENQNAPPVAKQGVIHVANPNVARGAHFGPLMKILSNPVFLALIVAAAIAIPLAVDDNDDAS